MLSTTVERSSKGANWNADRASEEMEKATRAEIRDAAVNAIGNGWKTAREIADITGHSVNKVGKALGFYKQTFKRKEKGDGTGYYGPTIYGLAEGMGAWVEHERQSK